MFVLHLYRWSSIHIPFSYTCVGGVLTGGLSDLISGRAITCVFMMYMAVPTVSTIYTNNNTYTIFIVLDNNWMDCYTSASSSTVLRTLVW